MLPPQQAAVPIVNVPALEAPQPGHIEALPNDNNQPQEAQKQQHSMLKFFKH